MPPGAWVCWGDQHFTEYTWIAMKSGFTISSCTLSRCKLWDVKIVRFWKSILGCKKIDVLIIISYLIVQQRISTVIRSSIREQKCTLKALLHSQRMGDDVGGLIRWLVGRPAQSVKVCLPLSTVGNRIRIRGLFLRIYPLTRFWDR